MADYSKYNAQAVLDQVNKYISDGFSLNIRCHYDSLSIFDWWTDRLSVSQMKQMRTFLTNAIRLGYTGYVCFKVGASGCANGMWAHKAESTNGYSPDGDCLFRSFSPDYTYWQAQVNNTWFPADKNWNECKTIKDLEKKYLQTN